MSKQGMTDECLKDANDSILETVEEVAAKTIIETYQKEIIIHKNHIKGQNIIIMILCATNALLLSNWIIKLLIH